MKIQDAQVLMGIRLHTKFQQNCIKTVGEECWTKLHLQMDNLIPLYPPPKLPCEGINIPVSV